MILQKKICMLGSFAVGKTSLVSQYVKRGYFKEIYQTTFGVKVDKKIVEIDGQKIMLMLWDMAGEEALTTLHEKQLRAASGYLLVADGTRGDTLKHARDIQESVRGIHPNIPFIFVINKTDLKETWEIEEQEIDALEQEGWRIIRSSAKTGEGVEEAFLWLARLIVEG